MAKIEPIDICLKFKAMQRRSLKRVFVYSKRFKSFY